MSWDDCQRVRGDIAAAYLDGAHEILEWKGVAQCRRLAGDARLECAMAGFNEGWSGARRGTNAYARSVLRLAGALRRALEARLDA